MTGPTVQVGQEKEMSAIYGAEHFLRMLGTSWCPCHRAVDRLLTLGLVPTVSLPQMVATSSMDGESVGLLRDYVNELLQ